MSFTVTLDNRTPFASEVFLLPDGHGQELNLLVLKASFVVSPDGLARLADEQRGIGLIDEWHGEPGVSVLIRDHDLAPHKPMVDVIGHGQAYGTTVELHLA